MIVAANAAETGDASVGVAIDQQPSPLAVAATVSVGDLLTEYAFIDYDSERPLPERAEHVAEQVARFLTALVDDRILLWVSDDGAVQGWRECGSKREREPLVADNRLYRRGLWSGLLPVWRASDAIVSRRAIESEIEGHILREAIRAPLENGLATEALELAIQILEIYEERRRSQNEDC